MKNCGNSAELFYPEEEPVKARCKDHISSEQDIKIRVWIRSEFETIKKFLELINQQYRRLLFQRNETKKLSLSAPELIEDVAIIEKKIKEFIKSFDGFSKLIRKPLDPPNEQDSLPDRRRLEILSSIREELCEFNTEISKIL